MRRLFGLALLLAGCFAENDSLDSGGEAGSGSTAESSGDATSTTSTGTSGEVTSVDGSSSDSGQPLCGNGFVDGDEACDDGDEDEEDGCTSACELGARALTMMEIAPPGPPIGPEGPIMFSDSCFDEARGTPKIVEDLYGRRAGENPMNAWTVSAGGNCSGLELDWNGDVAQIVETPDDAVLAEQGNFDPLIDGWMLRCGDGTLPVGLSGVVYLGDPQNIVSLRLECAAFAVDGDAPNGLAFMPSPPTAWTPTMTGGDESTLLCPPGAVMVGFRGDIDADATAMYRLGPECAVPVVAFGPG